MADLVRLSKYLALILRHRAGDFGISLDEDGFASLEAVWALVERRYAGAFTRRDLETVLAGDTDGKKRFELVGDRIRALYGHSRVRPVHYPPAEPPEILFHGTYPGALGSIRSRGLRPMKRQYVHLSSTEERALNVGARRAEQPVLLRVRARQASAAGIVFHNPELLHWLAQEIPPEFIEFPPV